MEPPHTRHLWKACTASVRPRPRRQTSSCRLGYSFRVVPKSYQLGGPPFTIRLSKTDDDYVRVFHIYYSEDESKNLCCRLQLVVHPSSTVTTFFSAHLATTDDMTAKKIHRFTHAHPDEVFKILKDVGIYSPSVMNVYRELTSSCDLCLSSGFPSPRRKISLTHVNEAFNSELQADFTFPYFEGSKGTILNIIDTGTAYGERILVPNTSAASVISSFEQYWLYRHGAPKSFGVDQEFDCDQFRTFLRAHSIQFFPRPDRSSHKSGRVERNNAVFKLVFDRIYRELTSTSLPDLVQRDSFLTNMFHGNATLSSFQLVRGYSP